MITPFLGSLGGTAYKIILHPVNVMYKEIFQSFVNLQQHPPCRHTLEHMAILSTGIGCPELHPPGLSYSPLKINYTPILFYILTYLNNN